MFSLEAVRCCKEATDPIEVLCKVPSYTWTISDCPLCTSCARLDTFFLFSNREGKHEAISKRRESSSWSAPRIDCERVHGKRSRERAQAQFIRMDQWYTRPQQLTRPTYPTSPLWRTNRHLALQAITTKLAMVKAATATTAHMWRGACAAPEGLLEEPVLHVPFLGSTV